MPFDYSLAAARYDVTRGGQKRAQAAEVAIAEPVSHPGTLLDVAGETIIVSNRIAARGLIPAGETSFVAVSQHGDPHTPSYPSRPNETETDPIEPEQEKTRM